MKKVMKFGGSSLADAGAIARAVEITVSASKNNELIVVVSALKGVTDELISIANSASQKDTVYKEKLDNLKKRHTGVITDLASAINSKQINGKSLYDHDNSAIRQETLDFIDKEFLEIADIFTGVSALGELSLKVLDRVMSFGEICNAVIFVFAARTAGIDAKFKDSRDFIVTDNNFGKARVNFEKTDENLAALKQKSVLVFPGFVAKNEQGQATTLGRDGSDYTAAILGAGTDSSVVELWTDVDGVLTANPAYVKNARSILQMTYEEAMELSHFGARVIHSPTMRPVTLKNIPLKVKNTFNPKFRGTLIGSGPIEKDELVTGISTISNVSFISVEGGGMVGVRGVAGRLFTTLAESGVNLIMISQGSSEHSICFALSPHEEYDAVLSINREFEYEIARGIIDNPIVESSMCVLAIVGENMRRKPGIAGRLFMALGDAEISVKAIAQGASERNISIVIKSSDESLALNAIHSAFFSTQV